MYKHSGRVLGGCLLLILFGSAVIEGFSLAVTPGTIYICGDGTVDPATAPIQREEELYIVTDDVSGELVVERDHIVIDGGGHILAGTRGFNSKGIDLSGRTNVTIMNVVITDCVFGMWLNASINIHLRDNTLRQNKMGVWLCNASRNNITSNNVTGNLNYGIYLEASAHNDISSNMISENNYCGVYLTASSHNTVLENTITSHTFTHVAHTGIQLISSSNNNRISRNSLFDNTYGLYLWKTQQNTVSDNNITHNTCGILLANASNNTLFHNNFINNLKQVESISSSNRWDNGTPGGGNYWSASVRAPYIIDGNNQDRYPLMTPWAPEGMETSLWAPWWLLATGILVIGLVVGFVFKKKKANRKTTSMIVISALACPIIWCKMVTNSYLLV